MHKILDKIKQYNSLSDPVKASLWYTICNVLQKGMALLSTPIFTRLLNQSQYGRFTLFQSWNAILAILCTLNLFQAVYTRGLLKYENDQKKFTASLLGLTTFITLGFSIVYIAFIGIWTNLFQLSPFLMLLMFIQLFLMTPVEFWSAKERFDYKYKKFVVVTMTTTVLSILLGIVLILSTKYKVEARILGDTLAKGIFGLFLMIYLFKGSKHIFNREYWKYALVFNIPLIPHFLSTFVLNQADRVLIGRLVGDAEAGIYSIAYTISMMMLLIVNAINNALVPYIYRKLRDKNIIDIRNNVRGLFVLIMFLSLFTMFFAPEVVRIFAGATYMSAIWIIPPIAMSVYFIFCYSMFSTVEYYYQQTITIAIISIVCALLNILLNLVFIPLYGYFAAGYVTLVCYILFSVLHYLVYTKGLKKDFGDRMDVYDIKFVLILAVLGIISMFIMLPLYAHTVIRYILAGIFIILAFVKRNAILSLIKIDSK